MSTMTSSDELTRQQADSTKRHLEEVWEAIDSREEYEGQPAIEYLDQWPLEIVWEVGEPFAVLLGTGGHVEITGGGRQGGYDLHVYWGGSHARESGSAITRTGEYFRELMEQS